MHVGWTYTFALEVVLNREGTQMYLRWSCSPLVQGEGMGGQGAVPDPIIRLLFGTRDQRFGVQGFQEN